MAVRAGLLLLACVILANAVSAEWQLFDLVSGNEGGAAKLRARRATEDPNVVVCTNPCFTPAPGTDPITDATTEPSAEPSTEPSTEPSATTSTTEEPSSNPGPSDSTTEPGEPEPTTVTDAPTPIDPVTTEPGTAVSTDPSNPARCACSEQYSQRLSFIFVLLQNFDQRTANTFTVIIYNALDTSNTDDLSVSVRVILGLQEGNLMLSISYFQEQLSILLVRHARITVVLKHILEGKISTSQGIEILRSRFPASRKVNQNNIILIVISAMLGVNPSVTYQTNEVFLAFIISQMPQDRQETQFFLQINTIFWSLQSGNDNDVASHDLYIIFQKTTVLVYFGREIEFNEHTKDCDDSESNSDESSLEKSDESGDKSHGGEDSDSGSNSSDDDSNSDSDSGSNSKEHKGSKENKGSKEKGSKEKGSKEDKKPKGSKEDKDKKSKEKGAGKKSKLTSVTSHGEKAHSKAKPASKSISNAHSKSKSSTKPHKKSKQSAKSSKAQSKHKPQSKAHSKSASKKTKGNSHQKSKKQ